MARRCKHENADHLKPGDTFTMDGWAPDHRDPVLCEQFRCIDCGSWLSLGPSNDSSPEVQIEIRAAALVAAFDDCLTHFTVREYHGWNKCDQSIPFDDLADDEAPGYLAHAIATHTEET